MRNDLLALSDDDLAMLSNRGTFKRAQKEIEDDSISCTFNEADDGELTFHWSDHVKCRVLGGKTLHEAQCDCPSTTLCRHIIRSILFYREHAKNNDTTQNGVVETAWSPGRITDEKIEAYFKAVQCQTARKLFDSGQVIDLVVGVKPTARFRQESCTVRYLVPDDLRYTICDCRENAPCRHALVGVWAFRLLDPTQTSGIIETRRTELPIPHELLQNVENWLKAWGCHGLAHLDERDLTQLRKLETELRAKKLFYPAEIVEELLEEFSRYHEHDARFEPERLPQLLTELLIRMDAIRKGTTDIPQLFLRGVAMNKETQSGASKLLGLGSDVRCTRHHTLLTLYFQDADTGSVVRLERQFANPEDEKTEQKSFSQLASTVVLGVSMRSLVESHLTLASCKRLPGGRILPGRTRATVSPQAFQWEKLRSPLLVENFEEVQAILSALPPPMLRCRSGGEDFFVVPLQGTRNEYFDPVKQELVAELVDKSGGVALVRHPYHSRGASGFEALYEAIHGQNEKRYHACFVAGRFRCALNHLHVDAASLVFEKADRTRYVVQPWISDAANWCRDAKSKSKNIVAQMQLESLLHEISFANELSTLLEETLLIGFDTIDAKTVTAWEQIRVQAQENGFVRLAEEIDGVTKILRHHNDQVRFDTASLAEPLLRLCVVQSLLFTVNTGQS